MYQAMLHLSWKNTRYSLNKQWQQSVVAVREVTAYMHDLTYNFPLAKLSQSLTKQVSIMNGCLLYSINVIFFLRHWCSFDKCACPPADASRAVHALFFYSHCWWLMLVQMISLYKQRGASTRKITTLFSNRASLTMSPSRSWLYCCVYITFHEWVKLNMADWEKGRKWFQREEVSSGKPGEESLKAHPESKTWLNFSAHMNVSLGRV